MPVPVPMSATRRPVGTSRASARARSASSSKTLRSASHSGPTASKKDIREFRKKLQAKPGNYIAQPTLALSTAPIFTRAGLSPRHLDLRPFVLVSPNGIEITPGGLTRVALKKGSLVVNSSQGGGTKDTWVLEDE